ncbi:MAG: glycerophosphodiester phosphodiesterase [Thermoleophilia bacterium]|nr:glycerophosphodiester phosphodiesterase [Thermoleophilia bacterium]
MTATPPRPAAAPPSAFLVAHGAGNRLDDLRAAEALGVALVEADVRLFRGRPEVRHLKTVGPLPLYWDRWTLAPPWRRHLRLGELLAATHARTELMLDLKGARSRLAALVAAEIARLGDARRLTVCARSWRLLEPFESLAVRRVYSVGSARQLRRLLGRFPDGRLDAVSVHARLLDRHVVAQLREIATTVMTWPVNDAARARALLGLGVHGLISDAPERVAGALPRADR